MDLRGALRSHWPEYLIEAWALCMFMLSAGVVTTLVEDPASAVRLAIDDADLRRALIGVAMGLTAIALIYSPWGARSGAHMNPAVTLAFARLGRIAPADAFFYVLAQLAGGLAGVLLAAWLLGPRFTGPAVNWVVTLPGHGGIGIAFAAETAMSFALMLAVLLLGTRDNLARYTGIVAGVLVALYISFEAPLSGMSINPARSFASAAPAGIWQHHWIYWTAPFAGMFAATAAFAALGAVSRRGCVKLFHPLSVRCIYCGHEPAPAGTSAIRPLNVETSS
jgi:aquaporin Z